jgi:RNA polymerase sigma factor (sigma-70 family)
MFVIAHRRLIDERRRASRRPAQTHWDAAPVSATVGGDVEREAIEFLATEEILRAFDQLTDDQRNVLALRIIGGFTLEETASMVGKRIGAVKALQRRALQALAGFISRAGVTL